MTPEDPRARGIRPDADSDAWVWLIGGVGLLMAFYPTIFSGFRLTQHDIIDSRMNNYTLEHSWRWLTGDPAHASYWDPPLFYPVRNTAAYTDVLLATAPLYWMWRGLGLPYDLAFDVWAITLGTLNYAVAIFMLRRTLGVSMFAASGGAFLFAFASSRLVQLGHIQLLPHFFTALTVVTAARLCGPEAERRSARWWVLLLYASVVGQLYAGYYLGWFLCFSLVIAAFWGLLFEDTRTCLARVVRRQWLAILAGGALTALVLSPLVLHSLAAARVVGFRTYSSDDLPSVWSWIYVSPFSWLYGWMAATEPFRALPGPPDEQWLGVGIVTTIIAVMGLWNRRASAGIRVMALTALTIVLLSSRLPFGFEPWRVVHAVVPGANAVRAISRIGLMLLIAWPVGTALWLNARRRGVAVLALCVIASEQLIRFEYGRRAAVAEAAAGAIAGISTAQCDAFMYAPADPEPYQYVAHVHAMLGQLAIGIPTLNGYSGNAPPDWPFSWVSTKTPREREQLALDMRRWAERHALDPTRICVSTGPTR